MLAWVLAALVIVFSAFVTGCNEGESREAGKWERERATLNASTAAAERKARMIEQQAFIDVESVRKNYANQLLVRDSALADAHDELRRRASVRPRAPAATAPAVCRDHDATPGQLSLPDKEFLVGESDRADRIVVQLNACQRYLEAIAVKDGQ